MNHASIQYVGFKQVWPDVDTQIPLEEAYQAALAMYEIQRGRKG